MKKLFKILSSLVVFATLFSGCLAYADVESLSQISNAFQASGDLPFANQQTKPARLPIGTAGQVLVVGSNGFPGWSSSPIISGTTGDFTITAGDLILTKAASVITGGATSITLSSGNTVILRTSNDANRILTFGGASDSLLSLVFGDSGGGQGLNFIAGSPDGTDTGYFCASGGGACEDTTRGAYFKAYGADSTNGNVQLSTANMTGASLRLLAPNATGSVTIENASGTVTFTSGVTTYTTAAYKIIPGATSFNFSNSANSGINLSILDAGHLQFGAAAARIIPGATSFTFRNNANNADNLSITDAGVVTVRDVLNVGSDLNLSSSGKSIIYPTGGANATSGTFTCNGVTAVVVNTTKAAIKNVVVFGLNTTGGTASIGYPYVSAVSAGTSFSVKCSVAGETAVWNWAIIQTL